VTIRIFRSILLCSSFLFLLFSCSKINEATDLGDDIIPGVDGVHTFDTTLTVETYDSIFDPLQDSVRVNRTADHILGNIVSDPFFGKTNAKIFLEMKPSFYRWNFSGVDDSLYIDSVVMVLGWKGTWGDTMAPQRVSVYELDPTNDFKIDSFYTLRNEYFTHLPTPLGTKDFFPHQLNDTIKAIEDTVVGQLRIRLSNAFGQRLLDYDTTNAYLSDSAFKVHVKGFAIAADQSFGNALMAFGLVNDARTKLAIYYRYEKDGVKDTTVSYFQFTGASAQHNFIKRDFAGTPVLAAQNDPGQDDFVYLLNTPGTYAKVKVPALKTFPANRVINRAEMIVEQVFDLSDRTFTPPEALLLDIFDSTLGDYRYVPYDYTLDNNGVPISSFGFFGRNTADGAGNSIAVWKFNVTRYVQNILTKKESLHDFRLVSKKTVFERLGNSGIYQYYGTTLNSQFAFGRVRVGGGSHPTQRMRLRIVYTKI
jgi:hypothetical protein